MEKKKLGIIHDYQMDSKVRIYIKESNRFEENSHLKRKEIGYWSTTIYSIFCRVRGVTLESFLLLHFLHGRACCSLFIFFAIPNTKSVNK